MNEEKRNQSSDVSVGSNGGLVKACSDVFIVSEVPQKNESTQTHSPRCDHCSWSRHAIRTPSVEVWRPPKWRIQHRVAYICGALKVGNIYTKRAQKDASTSNIHALSPALCMDPKGMDPALTFIRSNYAPICHLHWFVCCSDST